MIGYLEGRIIFSDGVRAILMTKMGVGYEVFHSKLAIEGEEVKLFISHIIKEASQDLYAFPNFSEKMIFELFLKVKGVGAKSAYAIVKHLGPSQAVQAIKFENKKLFQSVPGIGPKAAAQIILDLKNKVDQLSMTLPLESSWLKNAEAENRNHGASVDPMYDDIFRDTLMACQELGFKELQVVEVVKELLKSEQFKTSEQMLQKVLKNLAVQTR